jgi:hypothetical protein
MSCLNSSFTVYSKTLEIKSRLISGCLLAFGAESLLFQFDIHIKIKMHKTIILSVVLYDCETWSLTREEHRHRVFENRVMGKVLGAKIELVTGD